MIKTEVKYGYPALRRQWPGRALRLIEDGRKDFPDFTLIHEGRVAFVEVKGVDGRGRMDRVKDLTPGQAIKLDELHEDGLNAGLLVYVHHDTAPYWAWFTPPIKIRIDQLFVSQAERFSGQASPPFIFGDDDYGLEHPDGKADKRASIPRSTEILPA